MTLQEVARQAGVSTPTISKVLNGRPDVAPATRERVLQILREQQYLPRGASALPSAHKHVELVFDALNNPNNLEMMRGIIAAAEEHGGHVAVSTLPENLNTRAWVNELERVGRAGLIIATSHLTAEHHRWLTEAALPLVMIDPIDRVESLASVGSSNWQGGMTAVQHLLELGHRRIALLRGYACLVDDARYHGYVAALTRCRSDPGSGTHPAGRLPFRAGRDGGGGDPAAADRPTAVFAANDLEALGVMEAARRLGLQVPGDLSVVGFDDSVLAATASPLLTTVSQSFAQMGEVAYRILSDRMEGRESPSLHVELATTLVVRDSTAPL